MDVFLVLLPQTPRAVRFTCEKMHAATALGTLKGQEMFSSLLDTTKCLVVKEHFTFPDIFGLLPDAVNWHDG